MSSTFLKVLLPSGNQAVYSVPPHHLNETPGMCQAELVRFYGSQVAHEIDGRWYKPRGWEPITDPRTLALLRTCPLADCN